MALDDADLKKISELVTAQIGAAFKPEAVAAVIGPVVKAHVAEATKGAVTPEALKAQIEDLTAKLAAKSDEEPADKGAKGKGKDEGGAADPRVAAMERKLAEVEAAHKAALQAAADEKAKARTSALHTAAREALIKAGADPARIHLAMPAITAAGQLDYDGDRPGWRGKDHLGLDAVLDMDAAAKAWLATSDGKLFVPPADTRGTGDGNGDRNAQRSGTASGIRNADGSLNIDALAGRVMAAS